MFSEAFLIQLVFFVLSGFALIISSRWLIDASRRIAVFLHISEFAVGFILVAFATSLPEFFVGINAGLAKQGEIVIGNVIGANISDILLVLGVSALIGVIHVQHKQLIDNAEILLFITLVPLILLWRGTIGFFSGLVLLVVFVIYLFLISRTHGTIEMDGKTMDGGKLRTIALFVVGAIVLIFSSGIFVNSAVQVADSLNVSKTVIGFTLVALGTTMAELIVNIQAMFRKAYNLALGNILGSCVVNLTLVLGSSAILNEIKVDFSVVGFGIFFLVCANILLWYVLTKYGKIDKKFGVVFLAAYVLFLAIESGFFGFFGVKFFG